MDKFIIFGALSVFIIVVSWRTFFSLKSHGFYRFISWECMAWLIAANYSYWFVTPFSFMQILSWLCLILSTYLIFAGVMRLKKSGKPGTAREDKTLYKFEQTTELTDTGIYKYIRHPLYSSLLFLNWGIFLKNTSTVLFGIAFVSSLFLYLTAIQDEKECVRFFGEKYKDYMKRSRRFIPFIF